jgi:hypothetical protein
MMAISTMHAGGTSNSNGLCLRVPKSLRTFSEVGVMEFSPTDFVRRIHCAGGAVLFDIHGAFLVIL